ncbi:hypothetical protein [Amycolatopsis sp. cmx-4-68]|uniref:hypothetical protein n=1 Tax=Amycolatopsis sp. cmx-4-68 TaxID=2790938 RepID=UPI0039793298
MSEYASPQALAGAIGAHTSWANTTDRAARTAPARKASLERFEREVDPDGTLPPEERARRATHKRKAYFLGLAAKSAASRRRTAAHRAEAKAEELESKIQAELDAAAGGEVA